MRIECFDISNIQGRDIVASMTVFVDAQPKKAHYRTFSVKRARGQDDFASLAQVVGRRFARLRDARSRTLRRELRRLPNLIVIDGGKGQLAAALEAIHSTYDVPRVAVIALAKREEEVFVPGSQRPIVLERHDPGLQLLQRIRDEAHRFAVTYHRQRRDTRAFSSIFDTLEGIGPSRRRAILHHFGSADRFWSPRRRSSRPCPGCLRRRRAPCSRSCIGPGRRLVVSPVGRRPGSELTASVARRKRTVRKVSRIDEKPTAAFTTVSVIFMPTLKASETCGWPGRAGCRAGTPVPCRCRRG